MEAELEHTSVKAKDSIKTSEAMSVAFIFVEALAVGTIDKANAVLVTTSSNEVWLLPYN